MSQLVRADVRLKRPGAVEIPKAGRHATKGAEDDEPGTQAAFGILVSISFILRSSLVLLSSLFAGDGSLGGDERDTIENIKGRFVVLWNQSILP